MKAELLQRTREHCKKFLIALEAGHGWRKPIINWRQRLDLIKCHVKGKSLHPHYKVLNWTPNKVCRDCATRDKYLRSTKHVYGSGKSAYGDGVRIHPIPSSFYRFISQFDSFTDREAVRETINFFCEELLSEGLLNRQTDLLVRAAVIELYRIRYYREPKEMP